MITALLPVICWLFIALTLYKRGQDGRTAFLSASVIWGVLLTGGTEALSLFRGFTFSSAAIFWLSATLISVIIFFTSPGGFRSPDITIRFDLQMLLGGAALIATITGFIALVSPPNNWDSMTYHMSRVVHWIQNQGVQHYPTHILRQIELNPWAEFAIMHFQILTGHDHLANLVQWFSMIGCIVGVSLIARQLGADLRGQVHACVITATIPMGILQASSTQNDYVVSFWLVCFVFFGLLFKHNPSRSHMIFSASSLGLALLTKGTAYIYALPFIVWFLISGVSTLRWKMGPLVVITAIVVLALNLGHYQRNYHLFHNPLSSGQTNYYNDHLSVPSFVSNSARNLALHLGTRSQRINKILESPIAGLHRLLGTDMNDPKTTWGGTTFAIARMNFHEDTAGNPLHILLLFITMAAVLSAPRFRLLPNALQYLGAIISAASLFCFLLKWQPWASRLHLPLFVLSSSLAGTVMGMSGHKRTAHAVMIILLLAAVPAVIRNVSRPLLSGKYHQSILRSSRLDQYFSNLPLIKESYHESIKATKSQKCESIGLRIGEDDWEYPIWVLANEMYGHRPRIEHIEVYNASANMPLFDFQPCAVLMSDNDKKLQVKFIH